VEERREHKSGFGGVVLLVSNDDELRDVVMEAAARNNVGVCDYTHISNFIAIGCFLAVVDPRMISPGDWANLCEWLREINLYGLKILLVRPSVHSAQIPKRYLLGAPEILDYEILKFLILRLRRALQGRLAVQDKKERQIRRLMYILYRLDTTSRIRVRDVVEEFSVTPRTVQRDLEALSMAGYVILETEEQGVYRFPEDYKVYEPYYG